jgi:hypothetical protein
MDSYYLNHREAGISATRWARIIPREPVPERALARLGLWVIRESNGHNLFDWNCPDGDESDGRFGPVLRDERGEQEPITPQEQVKAAKDFVYRLTSIALHPRWIDWERRMGHSFPYVSLSDPGFLAAAALEGYGPLADKNPGN